MKGAIGRLQSALAKLEDTLESTRSIGQKLIKETGLWVNWLTMVV